LASGEQSGLNSVMTSPYQSLDPTIAKISPVWAFILTNAPLCASYTLKASTPSLTISSAFSCSPASNVV